MKSQFLFPAALLLSSAFAVPQPTQALAEGRNTTFTLSGTLTFNIATPFVTNVEPTPTTTSTATESAYTATEIYAFRPGAPFHLLPFQALGEIFRLGGGNGAYCPQVVEEENGCDFQNITGFNGCALSVEVPGGQAVYMAPDGQLKYTQAHSEQLDPPNSQVCPLIYRKANGSDAICVEVSGFNATSFIACPVVNSSTNEPADQPWQVYGKVPNNQIPVGGPEYNSSICTEFEAVGIDKQLGNHPAAWEYI